MAMIYGIRGAASHILMSKYYRDGRADAGTLKEAIRHGQRAVDLGDNNHHTYYSLGHACTQLGNENAAIKYFEQAVVAYPDFLDAKSMLGSIMSCQKGRPPNHYKRAIKYLEDVLDEDPSKRIGASFQDNCRRDVN